MSDELLAMASGMLRSAGLPADRAAVVAEVLLEADLLGFRTHGLVLLSSHLSKLMDRHIMRTNGDPIVLSDRGATFNWDADHLPGPWVMVQALDQAAARLKTHGVVTATIRRSQHIACLAAYLQRATSRGHVCLIMASCPAEAVVCAHGGAQPVMSPNPIAAGFPTSDRPILMDISMSAASLMRIRIATREGTRMDGLVLKDGDGLPTDDPSVVEVGLPGSIMPAGGLLDGHKGFALTILTEVMTAALGGYGRADGPTIFDNSVFLQLIDPEAFGGLAAFTRETSALSELCRQSKVAAGDPAVRMPGDGSLARRHRQLDDGVNLPEAVMIDLAPWSARLNVPLPTAR